MGPSEVLGWPSIGGGQSPWMVLTDSGDDGGLWARGVGLSWRESPGQYPWDVCVVLAARDNGNYRKYETTGAGGGCVSITVGE